MAPVVVFDNFFVNSDAQNSHKLINKSNDHYPLLLALDTIKVKSKIV